MSTFDPRKLDPAGLGPMERDIEAHVRTHWKGYALQGTASLVIGAIAILAPLAATFATVLFFGVLLIVSGVVGIVSAFTMRGASGRGAMIGFSVLTLILGALILFDPFAGAVSLTMLLAVFLLLSGLANFTLARALRTRGGRSFLLFLSAGLNAVLAFLLVLGLPATAVWAVGLFLGFSFLVSGAGLLGAALGARNA